MKLNDVKHNHSLTDLLKVLLFAIVMLLPFIDVFVRCGYVMFNKNAYQSYSGEQYEYENHFTSINDVEMNSILHFDSSIAYSNQSNINSGRIYYTNVSDLYSTYTTLQSQLNEGTYFIYYVRSDNRQLYIYNDQNTLLYSPNLTSIHTQFNFKILAFENNIVNVFPSLSEVTQQDNNYLDNVFEYSVSQLEESSLYNWTTQTAIYSGVSQMTTQLGITTNIIPIIVCYWFFITIIYIILDIIIRLFTILTHFIGSKTAN